MAKRFGLRLLLMSVSATLMLATGTAFAEKIAYEPFDYPIGLLNTDNGGTGFLGPWLANPGVVVVSPGLSSPFGLPSRGLKIGGAFDAFRQLAVPLTQPVYWVSFQLQEITNNDQVWLGLDTVPSNTPILSFGRRLDHYFIGMGSSELATFCCGSPLGVTDLMVARFTQLCCGSTLIEVWLNNLLIMTAVIPTVPYTFLNMQVQDGLFADEVRMGTTWGDVAAGTTSVGPRGAGNPL